MDHHFNTTEIEWIPFALTHVEFPKGDFFGKVLAIASLMPMAIICGFITLILFRRDLHTVTFFIGLLVNEGLNMVLKYTIREARPLSRQVNYTEFGMPSSHSQLMWYFAAYFIYFTLFRLHGYPGKEGTTNSHKAGIIATVTSIAAFVAYSRIYLMYHTFAQVMWGGLVGTVFATFWFLLTEIVFTPKFQEICTWPMCEYLLIRDNTMIPNVMWFEFANAKYEIKTRMNKQS